MAYSLTEINRRCREDAAAFIADCDADYAKKLALAAPSCCCPGPPAAARPPPP